jgi:PAS domain S-box-containing protein
VSRDQSQEIETVRLLLEAARYLGETLEPERVYRRFREIMAEPIPHDGVIVSSFDPRTGVIRCDYAWVEGEVMDVSIFPELQLQAEGGMQSEVIRTGRPLLTNDVAARVQDSGTYYDVDSEGTMRRVPEEGAPMVKAAMMIPIKHEGVVVGVVQLMTDHGSYDERQLELAEGIVAQLGASVRNARLHEERLKAEAEAAAASAVSAERERAAQVLEAVGDGVFFTDRDGAIRFWNPAAETITSLRRDDVRDRSLHEIPGGWAALAEAVTPAQSGERPRPVTLPIELDGRELWLSFVAVRIADGIVYAFRDLTSERQFEQSKHDFIATVSHELRTPMTGVLGAAKTLLREDLELSPETRRELIEMIATEAQRLSEVTESVLLAGRLDRHEVAVEARPLDVDCVVRDTVAALQSTLPPGMRVEYDLAAPGLALGDANRLQQVLVNLIDNGVKYAREGGLVRLRTYGDASQVCIDVADRGPGIPAAEQDRIFEKFFRSSSSQHAAPGGSGLGLYICRELVERMSGRIHVASARHAGATFTVELTPA